MYTCQIFRMFACQSCTQCIHIEYIFIQIRSTSTCIYTNPIFCAFTYQICTQCIHVQYMLYIHLCMLKINLYVYMSNFLHVYTSKLYSMYTYQIHIYSNTLQNNLYVYMSFFYMFTYQICTQCINAKYVFIWICSESIWLIWSTFAYSNKYKCIHTKYVPVTLQNLYA